MRNRDGMLTTVRTLAGVGALGLCCILAACGGGGGGSSGGGGGDDGGVGTPPPPPITYHGATVQAPANGTTAIAFGSGVVFAADEVRAVVSGIDKVPPGTYDKDVACDQGGSAHLSGTIHGDYTGTLKENYQNCSQAENGVVVTLDGLVVIVYHSTSTAKQLDFEIQFKGVSLSGGGANLGLTGDVAKVVMNNRSETFDADLLLTNHANGVQVWMHPLSIDDEPDPDSPRLFDTTLSGRYYDSAFGYMPVSTPTPLISKQDAKQPYSGGPLSLTGKGGHVLLAPLTAKYASLGTDSNDDGFIERGNVFDWTTNAFLVDEDLAPAPVADARCYECDSRGQQLGEVTVFDARMSRERGSNFLGYHWQLLLSPPGSAVQLAHADEARVSFRPDIRGDYLLRLTVTDGRGHSSSSAYRIYAFNSGGTGPQFVGAADIGPDETAQVGQLIRLDSDTSVTGEADPEPQFYSWSLLTPPGSQATLEGGETLQNSFTPDVPGIYRVSLDISHFPNTDMPADTKLISVGANPVHFDGAVLQDPAAELVHYLAVGDLNHDGRPDIAEGSDKVQVVFNEAGGKLSAPVVLTSLYPGGLAIGDLNNDGLNDLVAGLNSDDIAAAALVFMQDNSGFAPAEQWSCTECNFGGGHAPTITHLFGQPWNSLWMATGDIDDGPFVALDLNSNGTQDPQYLMQYGQFVNSILREDYTLADINGDGIRDLAFLYEPFPGNVWKLAVSLGQAGRSFAQPTLYDTGQGSPVSADLDGDGFADILSFEGEQLVVRHGQANGELSAPVAYAAKFAGLPLWTVRLPDTTEVLPAWLAEENSDQRNYLSYFSVNADGTLGTQWLYPILSGYDAYAMQSADLDGDGISDLVMFTSSGDVLVLFGSPWPAQATTSSVARASAASAQPRTARAMRILASIGRLLAHSTPGALAE